MTLMTDERLEELQRRYESVQQKFNLGDTVELEMLDEIKRLRLASQTARVAALHEAAKAMCVSCARGNKANPEPNHDSFLHEREDNHEEWTCEASAIHALLRKETNEPA